MALVVTCLQACSTTDHYYQVDGADTIQRPLNTQADPMVSALATINAARQA